MFIKQLTTNTGERYQGLITFHELTALLDAMGNGNIVAFQLGEDFLYIRGNAIDSFVPQTEACESGTMLNSKPENAMEEYATKKDTPMVLNLSEVGKAEKEAFLESLYQSFEK